MKLLLIPGLPPKEVHRQIECGLKDQTPLCSEQPPTPAPVVDIDLKKKLAELWNRPVPTPTVEPIPENVGDAWEHPLDRLGAGDGQASNERGQG